MEGLFLSSVRDGVADVCAVPFRREVRNGLLIDGFISKCHSSKESCRADEVSQKKDCLQRTTDLKTEQNFVVETPSSGLKESSALFFQVDQKLITPRAG